MSDSILLTDTKQKWRPNAQDTNQVLCSFAKKKMFTLFIAWLVTNRHPFVEVRLYLEIVLHLFLLVLDIFK